MQNRSFEVKTELNAQHSCLIIGCGKQHNHPTLHNKKEFYTIDIDPNRQPDLVGDVYATEVRTYLSRNKFKLIAIESVPALVMAFPDQLNSLYAFLASCLDKDGTLVILSSGNMKDYPDLYAALHQRFESFELHYNNVVGEDQFGKNESYPMCTIMASRSTKPKTKVVNDYINTGMELKHYSRGVETHIEIVKRPSVTPARAITTLGIHAHRKETERLLETDNGPHCKNCHLF